MCIKEKKRKYYLTIYNFKFKYVKKKNLHEGNILYFGLKVCKKTGAKKVIEIIFAVIRKGDKTPNCTNEGICRRLKVEVNTTCAKVEIPKTKISDGGSYSVEFLFTDVNSNFIVSQKLDVIETGK